MWFPLAEYDYGAWQTVAGRMQGQLDTNRKRSGIMRRGTGPLACHRDCDGDRNEIFRCSHKTSLSSYCEAEMSKVGRWLLLLWERSYTWMPPTNKAKHIQRMSQGLEDLAEVIAHWTLSRCWVVGWVVRLFAPSHEKSTGIQNLSLFGPALLE
jgi:hypothetical protein